MIWLVPLLVTATSILAHPQALLATQQRSEVKDAFGNQETSYSYQTPSHWVSMTRIDPTHRHHKHHHRRHPDPYKFFYKPGVKEFLSGIQDYYPDMKEYYPNIKEYYPNIKEYYPDIKEYYPNIKEYISGIKGNILNQEAILVQPRPEIAQVDPVFLQLDGPNPLAGLGKALLHPDDFSTDQQALPRPQESLVYTDKSLLQVSPDGQSVVAADINAHTKLILDSLHQEGQLGSFYDLDLLSDYGQLSDPWCVNDG